MDGIAATQAIRRELPEIEVLALTSVAETVLVVEAIFDSIGRTTSGF